MNTTNQAALPLESKARIVKCAAKSARFDGRNAYIADVLEACSEANVTKADLVAMHRKGLVVITVADLPRVYEASKLEASKTEWMGCTAHFVTV